MVEETGEMWHSPAVRALATRPGASGSDGAWDAPGQLVSRLHKFRLRHREALREVVRRSKVRRLSKTAIGFSSSWMQRVLRTLTDAGRNRIRQGNG